MSTQTAYIGTQLALVFRDSADLPHISPETAQPPAAPDVCFTVPADASSPKQPQALPVRTISDLLGALATQGDVPAKEVAMMRTAAGHCMQLLRDCDGGVSGRQETHPAEIAPVSKALWCRQQRFLLLDGIYDEIGPVKHTSPQGQGFGFPLPQGSCSCCRPRPAWLLIVQWNQGSTSHLFGPVAGIMISRFELPSFEGRQGAYSTSRAYLLSHYHRQAYPACEPDRTTCW
jgi:hypothetical protein